jgi:molecular chaperone HtpG
VLVDPEDGVGANMERILRAANQAVPETKRVLELNASHPLVQNLAKLHELGRHDVAEPIAHLLLDDARLMDGTVKEPAAIGRRLQALLTRATEQALA